MRSLILSSSALLGAVLLAIPLPAFATLAPVGSEIPVNSQVADDQSLPALAMRDEGSWAVAWQSGRGSISEIRLRLFNVDGVAQTADLVPRPTTTATQTHAQVAFLSNGSFVTTWQERTQPFSSAQVWAARFDAQSLTHLEFTLTVIDQTTGVVQSYTSDRGAQASGVDTQSFLGELPPFI